MHYSLLMPREVVFGCGEIQRLPQLVTKLGRRVLLVTGAYSAERSGLVAALHELLSSENIDVQHVGRSSREPTITDVDQLVAGVVSGGNTEDAVVIAVGGGATLDLGKAVAAMVTNARGRSVRDFLEGVGTGAVIEQDPLPLIAIPTTAGTGTEATKNAVISVDDPQCKKSLRDERMIPNVALIDPELTLTCSPKVTAAAGMDAITQLIESFISRRANRFTRALCLEGLQAAIPSYVSAVLPPDESTHWKAREQMSHAAFLSGVALANSGLGFAHGVAAALGAICDIPHGLACSTLLIAALNVNKEAVPVDDWILLDKAMCGSASSHGEVAAREHAWASVVDIIAECHTAVGLPKRLRDIGVKQDQLPDIAAGSMGNSMSGNPRAMTVPEVLKVLEEIW